MRASFEVEQLLQLEGARQMSTPFGQVITNSPFWNGNCETLDGVVEGFIRALNNLTRDPFTAEVSITTKNCVGPGIASVATCST